MTSRLVYDGTREWPARSPADRDAPPAARCTPVAAEDLATLLIGAFSFRQLGRLTDAHAADG